MFGETFEVLDGFFPRFRCGMFRVEFPIDMSDGIHRIEREAFFHEFIKYAPIEMFVFCDGSPGIGKMSGGDLSEYLVDLNGELGFRVSRELSKDVVDQFG